MSVFVALSALIPTPPVISAAALSTTTTQILLITPSQEPQTGIGMYALYRRVHGETSFQLAASILPTGFPYVDVGLAPGTTYEYQMQGIDQSPQKDISAPSAIVSATTQSSPITTGSINWNPGHRVWVGYQNIPSFATCKAKMDEVVKADVNNQIKGFLFNGVWAQWEGPTLGQYDNFGTNPAENGFTKFASLIALAKSYNPPRDCSFMMNGGGNGYSPISSTNFQSSFCPSYMSTANAGNTYGGGEVHIGTNGQPLDRPYIVIWNQNVVNAQARVFAAYYARFGTDIYAIDPYNEISVNQFAPGYSPTSLLTIFPSWCQQLRQAAPKWMILIKPTFVNPNNGASYGTIMPAMFNNHISAACEDCSPLHDWGMKAYLGLWAATPVNHTIANGGNPDWDYHCNVDPAELWNTSNNSAAIPPARYGSGLYYDGGPTNPGIMTTVKQLKASHVYWYTDAFGGPNVIRSKFSNANGVPANPAIQYGGPGAGTGVVAHPNIYDVLTGNTTYSGVTSTGLQIPWTQYPSTYPSN